jgi:hypothetical protein
MSEAGRSLENGRLCYPPSQPNYLSRTTPGKGKTGSAMSIIMNEGAGLLFQFQTHYLSAWAQPDCMSHYFGRF